MRHPFVRWATLAVASGWLAATVVWTNRDDIPHTVTSADGPRRFTSPPLDTGDHFSYRFDHAGRFAYFCSLHAHMQGVVVVK
jgi:plastocyanin